MQDKITRSALLITSLIALSLTTSMVHAGRLDNAPSVSNSGPRANTKPIITRNKGLNEFPPAPKAPEKAVTPKKAKPPVKRKPAPAVKTPKKEVSAKKENKKAPVENTQVPIVTNPPAAVVPIPVQPPSLQNTEKANIDELKNNVKEVVDNLEKEDKKEVVQEKEKEKEKVQPEIKSDKKIKSLGLTGDVVEGEKSGFGFHTYSVRNFIADGRPDLAIHEVQLAREAAGNPEQLDEVERLQSFVDVLLGKEVRKPIISGLNQPSDWQAIEVIRSSISGDKTSYSTIAALEEVSKWPDPVAALVVRNFAPLIDEKSANILLSLTDRLNKSGTLSPSVLPLVNGYVQKAGKNSEKALSFFETASNSVLGGVSSQAKLELLEAGMAKKAFTEEEIASAATDIINIKTNDHIERRALRILADNTKNADKINALRALENAEYNPVKKAVIKDELDKVIEQVISATHEKEGENIEEEVSEDTTKKVDIIEKNEEKPNEKANTKVKKEEPIWLLDGNEETSEEPAKKVKKTIINVKSINKTLGEAHEIIKSFEDK